MAGDIDDYQLEQRFRRRDGALIWGRVTMSAVKERGGRRSTALMMIEDITSRRQAEDALRASEEKLRGLFESVPVGLFRMTPAGVIVAANPAFLAMLGYDSAEMLQRLNIADLYADPGIRSAVRESLARIAPSWPTRRRFSSAVTDASSPQSSAHAPFVTAAAPGPTRASSSTCRTGKRSKRSSITRRSRKRSAVSSAASSTTSATC